MKCSIELRQTDGSTYLLQLRGADVVHVSTCRTEDLQDFVSDSVPIMHAYFGDIRPECADDSWIEDEDDEVLYGVASDYGDLLATRQPDGNLVIHDESGYAERLAFFGVQS